MEIKIFHKDTCPNCPGALKLGKKLAKEGYEVLYYDVQTPDGLTEAQYYAVLSTPTIVVTEEDEEITSFRGKTPNFEEIKKFLKKE